MQGTRYLEFGKLLIPTWTYLNLWEVKPEQHTVKQQCQLTTSEKKCKTRQTDFNVCLAFLHKPVRKVVNQSIPTWFYWRYQSHRSTNQMKQKAEQSSISLIHLDKSQESFLQLQGPLHLDEDAGKGENYMND